MFCMISGKSELISVPLTLSIKNQKSTKTTYENLDWRQV